MSEIAVLEKLLSVIRGHHDDRPLIDLLGGEQVEQGPQLLVPVGNGGIVELDVVGKICCDLVGSYSLIPPSLRRFPPGLHDEIVELEGVLHIVGKIRRIGEAAVVFLGNPVGIVDIEKMQVREKGFVGLLFNEGGCRATTNSAAEALFFSK